ncbi:MAG: hypothetical protein Q9211_007094, partial [Gyalolechia sp. 1 TL-2023]
LCLAAIPTLDENRGGELVAAVTVMMIIATTAVFLRLYARRISASKLGADDYIILLALILTYGLDINSYFSIKAGTGSHLITLTLDQITSFIKTYLASQILFGCSITATKLSILFFYHRLFPSRTFFIVSLIIGLASILWWVGLMLTAFLQCRPLAYNWDRSIPNGHCVNGNVIGYAITSVNIVTDLVVLVLPIPWLWGMNMAVPKRMAVVGLFVLGSLYVLFILSFLFTLWSLPPTPRSVCIAGIVRIPLLAELKPSDITWTSVHVGLWISVECNIGILSACLPILRPLFTTKYHASPVSYLARVIRTITAPSSHSTSTTTGESSSSSDPEKALAASEPSSDAIVVEGLKWPHDEGARNWRWGRNHGQIAAANQKPRVPAPGGGRRTETERARKYRTWYSAAADVLPEMDHRRDEHVFDADKVPRYRDDIALVEKPLPFTPNAFDVDEDGEDGGEAEKPERGGRRLEV